MTWKNVGNSIAPVGGLGITCEHARGTSPPGRTRYDEHRSGGGPVKLYLIDERPSALLAACAPTSGLLSALPVPSIDSAEAHAVGGTAVVAGPAVQAAQAQMQWRPVQFDGTTRLAAAANEHRTALKPIGASGIPP